MYYIISKTSIFFFSLWITACSSGLYLLQRLVYLFVYLSYASKCLLKILISPGLLHNAAVIGLLYHYDLMPAIFINREGVVWAMQFSSCTLTIGFAALSVNLMRQAMDHRFFLNKAENVSGPLVIQQ